MPYASSDKQKEWQARDYQNHKEYFRNKLKRRRIEHAIWLWELKKTMKCNRCGFDNPAALVFHHINEEEKDREVTFMLSNGWSKKAILAEIDKCEVLCANCHMIHHATQDERRYRMEPNQLTVCVTDAEDWNKN